MTKPTGNDWHWLHFLGAAPNAAQERKMSYEESKGWTAVGHLIMSKILYVPLLGGTVSLVGRISSYLASVVPKVKEVAYRALSAESIETDTSLTPTPECIKISKQNQKSAIAAHAGKASSYCSADYIDNIDFSRKASPMQITTSIAIAPKEKTGIVPEEKVQGEAQSCAFDVQSNWNKSVKGKCFGVVNGSGGKRIALNVIQTFSTTFKSTLSVYQNIRESFNVFISNLQNYSQQSQFIGMQSSALMCYIDEVTNIAHVATVGDSEACIIRQIGSEKKIIPLSLPNQTFINNKETLPTVSYIACPLEEGDVLILGSKGLYTFTTEEARIAIASENMDASEINKKLISSARLNISGKQKKINKKGQIDNITAIVIKVPSKIEQIISDIF